MDTLADYENWKSQQQQSGVGAAQVVLSSATDTPDEAASNANLASEFAKTTGAAIPPTPVVKEYRNIFQQKIEETKNRTILSTSPRLTEWLRNPDNASVARDDLQNLSWFEGFGRGSANTAVRGGLNVKLGANDLMFEQTAGRARDRTMSFGQILDDASTKTLPGGLTMPDGSTTVKTWDGSEYLSAFARWIDAKYADAIGTDDNEAARQFAANIADTKAAIAARPKSAIAQQFEQTAMPADAEGATLGQAVTNFGSAFARHPIGGLSWMFETAGESAPQMGAAIAAGALARNPAVGMAAMGGTTYATERYTSPVDYLKEKNIDLSNPADVNRLISDPTLLNEAAHRGVIRGAVMGAFATIAGGVGGVEFARNPIIDRLAQGATQAIIGATQEYAAQKATGDKVDYNKILASGVGQMALMPAEMAIAGRSFFKGKMKAARAEETQAQIDEIGQNAVNSKLRERMPDKFRDFVDTATANSPTDSAYVPADQFATYFQSKGMDPHEAIDSLDGVTRDDFDAALAGGGDIKVPISTYAAKIAGTDHDQFFRENMRFNPDEFTAREAAEFNAKSDDILHEAFEQAEAARMEAELHRSHDEEIYDTMVSRLRVAGRSTDVATNEASLYSSFYRTMADKSGMTMDDFLRRYPLPEVKGALPEGMQFKTVDDLTRALAEARSSRAVAGEKKGQSLLEFISDYGGVHDPGGELRARDAEVVRRGKGKKTLRLARAGREEAADMLGSTATGKKHGVDDVARAAIEAGYLPDDPVANEYRAAMHEGREVPDITRPFWDAIDRELRGSEERAGSAEPNENARLDSIDEYLSSLGVSLNDSDADIRTAVEGARQYAQAERPLLFQKNEAGARGSISFGSDGQSVIRLFENANLSTMLHETGHYFLTVMQDMARQEQATAKSGGTILYHGSPAHDLTLDNIEIIRAEGQKQGKQGRVYGGLYAADEARVSDAEGYAGEGGKVYRIELKPDAVIEQKEGDITRLSEQTIAEYRARGVDVVTGKDPRGRTEYAIINKDAIANFGDRSKFAASDNPAVADFDTVKSWWRDNAADVAADARRAMPDVKVTKEDVIRALDEGTTGDVMLDGAIDTGMQEQFARGFEAYLMDGKAPSAALRGAFEKFRSWLVSVYQKVAGLNVKVSDDIRGVMDRMLASDEQISRAATDAGGSHPLFATAEEMGLTPEQYDGFMKLRQQAEDDAKARLLGEAMAPIKREQEKAYKAEKANVRDEVARDVNSHGYYRALEWMGNRRWLGEGQPEALPDIRLSKSILVDQYGAGVLDTLPRGKQTIYTVDESGMHPDEAAGWFGFDSGDAMIRALERAPKRNEAIDAETERVMRERHGDPLNDGSIEAEALDAVHNDKRGQWLAAELKAVADVAEAKAPMSIKGYRMAARDTLSGMRVRDAINANRFLAAERKAAGEAAAHGAILAREGIWMGNARRRIATKARASIRGEGSPEAVAPQIEQANKSTGNYNETVAKLIDAKHRQLLNHSLYMEARKVAAEVEKGENYVAKLGKASVRERIAGAGRRENAQIDYLGAIDELLDRYDFRRLSNAAEQRQGALAAFIDRMKATGRENELSIPDKVMTDAGRKPYKTMPVEELRGVIDSLKNLEHVATRWDKLIDAQKERDFGVTVDGVAGAIDANLPKRPPGPVKTKGEQVRNTFRAYLDTVLNATTILREIDGFKDQGEAYQAIKAPIDAAEHRLITRKKGAAGELEKLYSVYGKDERRAMASREYMPELKMSISKWEKIALALNTGNEGNMSRLTDPRARRPFTSDQVAAVLGSLDARDADFVQSVWDYIGSFKNDIAARERRVTGVEPQWVEGSPVTIGGKELKGGYYPIKYDTRLSSTAADRETLDIAQSLAAGRFGKAQTRNGHLQERAAAGDGSIDLDMAVMHKHVNQVMYDLEMSEPVSNAWRLLQDGRVRSALDDAGRSADFDTLQAWLKDAAEGELGATSPVGAVLRGVKSNFTAAKLAFNISNALLQVAGVAQSFVVVGKRDMALGIAKTVANPFGMAREVASKSSFMENRQTTFNKDIMDFYSDPRQGMGASRWKEFKREVWGPLSFWLMQKVQWHFADVPTWVAGYHQGLRKFGNDEARAVAHADGLVKRAQASGLFTDRSGIERGSLSSRNRQNDVVKLFTTLGSYMFAKFNVAYERSAVASRNVREAGVSAKSVGEVASWALDMTFLFTLEALVGAAIKGQLPSQKEDDGKQDGWAAWTAKNTAFSVLGTLPFIRDGVSALQGHSGGGAYGSVIEDTAKGVVSAAKIAKASVRDDSDVKRGDVKNIVNATGVATGMPTVFLNRIVDAGWRQSEGGDVSPMEYIFGKMGSKK